jgi:hypothetical protein
MKYQVTKLDGRFSHSGVFNYMLEFSKNTWGNGTGVLDFDRARRWMSRTYGWSQDVETRSAIRRLESIRPDVTVQDEDINLHWAYSVAYKDYRIYLKSGKELTFFQLAHSGTK